MAATIEDSEATFREALKFIDDLLQSHVPKSIAEAKGAIDELDVKSASFDFLAGKWYPEAEQRLDRQRAIPAWKAIALVEQMADGYFNTITDKNEAGKTVVNSVVGLPIMLANIVSTVTSLSDKFKFVTFDRLKAVAEIVGNAAEVLSAPALAQLILQNRNLANDVTDQLRKSALPQRTGPRYRRRKRSRR